MVKKSFFYNTSGYCYNPDLPESGPSFDVIHLDWEELTGDTIIKQEYLNVNFLAEDDHYGSYSENDTGDVFTLIEILYNISTGDLHFESGIATFPGVCSASHTLHLKNITGGVGLLPIYEVNISISNCVEYPTYWKVGVFSEPDPGNAWDLELEFIYFTDER